MQIPKPLQDIYQSLKSNYYSMKELIQGPTYDRSKDYSDPNSLTCYYIPPETTLLDRVGALRKQTIEQTINYTEGNPCKSSALAFASTPVNFITSTTPLTLAAGAAFGTVCIGSHWPKNVKKEQQPSESAKPDISAAGSYLREQIQAERSRGVNELDQVICVGATIVDGQELTVPVDLRAPGTFTALNILDTPRRDPLGNCVTRSGESFKKIGYVTPSARAAARQIHAQEIADAKVHVREQEVLQMSFPLDPTNSSK